ncbi:unnamed protein product [Cyprideis torosa]|uniref:Uncharacterized protein n=1 Tax=Cyprideis torosa TaxID=163714 RepID=A0A7R8ZNQ6_9CRUS|nr:unnamed protein product [Cyprideis torosa]CAG0888267.1 unnamed protein product [Cyprideis torosa]
MRNRSVGNNSESFYFTGLLKLSRSLAAQPHGPWSKVEYLLKRCPSIPTESGKSWQILQRHQDALMALGVYFLESKFQHKEKILPYLLSVLQALPNAVWKDEVQYYPSDRVPIAERFSFCFNTLLSGVATREGVDQERRIIDAQIQLLSVLSRKCNDALPTDPKLRIISAEEKLQLCQSTVPLLLGLLRSLGRSTLADPALFLRLFPPPLERAAKHQLLVASATGKYGQRGSLQRTGIARFRPIIPRSLSQNFLSGGVIRPCDSGAELRTPADTYLSRRAVSLPAPPGRHERDFYTEGCFLSPSGLHVCLPKDRAVAARWLNSKLALVGSSPSVGGTSRSRPLPLTTSSPALNPMAERKGHHRHHHQDIASADISRHPDEVEPMSYFFHRVGSSFLQQISYTEREKQAIIFTLDQMQTILSIAKSLLRKDLLEFLDNQATDVFVNGKLRLFPYKTFKETLNLTTVAMLREILQQREDLPLPFTKDVQDFIKGLFLSGQTELQGRNHEASEREERETHCATVREMTTRKPNDQ